MVQGKGYWRVEDGTTVTREEAEAAWGEAAHDHLADVARTYHAVVEYGQLAEHIQAATGIRTSSPMRHWIGTLLAVVADRGHAVGEPPLTALVVQKGTGMVGEGYDHVLQLAGSAPITDPYARENHAAAARLACYRWAGVAEPAAGWATALAPVLHRTRERNAWKPTPERVSNQCPTCLVAMPLTGVCDTCA